MKRNKIFLSANKLKLITKSPIPLKIANCNLGDSLVSKVDNIEKVSSKICIVESVSTQFNNDEPSLMVQKKRYDIFNNIRT